MAKDKGFKIKVIYGYSFNREVNVFKDYVEDLYKTKAESLDKVHRNISKSLLNNLLGRFGMSIIKPITTILDDKTLDELSLTRVIINTLPISSNSNLVTLEGKVSKDICREFAVDYIEAMEKVYNIKSLNKSRQFSNVNVAISATVNSYARVYMAKLKLELLSKGYTLYYTDTDSIVVDKPLDPSLIGGELGKFKLEHKIKRGYFISSKFYCLVTDLDDGKNGLIVKAKGADSSTLNESDFVKLLKMDNVKVNKTSSKIRYADGSVDISSKEVTFNANAYKNRVKVYNNGI